MTTFEGIFPATITPMNNDFSINLESFKYTKSFTSSGFRV